MTEILDSLSTGATRTGSLRPSQSLDCCHRGDLDSCLSLVSPPALSHLPIQLAIPSPSKVQQLANLSNPIQPNLPGRPRWQPDEEDPPEPELQSLPAHLPSLQTPQLPDTMSSSKNLTPQPPSEASQEITSSSQSLTASADASSRGDLKSSFTEPRHQTHLPHLHEAARDPRAEKSPCSHLSTVPTQPIPPESPQPLVPTKPNSDITWTSQPLDSSSDPGSPENPRTQASEGLRAEHAHLQPPKGPGAPRSPATPASNWQEPQARSRPRVAELKKCFEG